MLRTYLGFRTRGTLIGRNRRDGKELEEKVSLELIKSSKLRIRVSNKSCSASDLLIYVVASSDQKLTLPAPEDIKSARIALLAAFFIHEISDKVYFYILAMEYVHEICERCKM